MLKAITFRIFITFFLGATVLVQASFAQEKSIVVSSTTSTEQSGLFSSILPIFQKQSGVQVKIVAVGTGQALDIGRRGDADVVFVHDKPAEIKFVDDGFATKRYEVMYNDFILIGPKSDPAKIVGGKDIKVAFQKIANAKNVLACAMINLGSVLKYLRETKPETVWIVGSGWEGSYSLEDTTCAGAIAANLEDEADFGNDEAVAAATLYKSWKGEVEELFYQASHGKRLLNLNGAEDIAYCAKLDVVDVLPKQSSTGLLVAA